MVYARDEQLQGSQIALCSKTVIVPRTLKDLKFALQNAVKDVVQCEQVQLTVWIQLTTAFKLPASSASCDY